jgi:hypothetical protein
MIVMVKVPRLSSVVPQTPRWRWVTGIVIFAVAYAVLLTAYFYDGRSGAFEGYTDKEPAPGGVLGWNFGTMTTMGGGTGMAMMVCSRSKSFDIPRAASRRNRAARSRASRSC